MVELSYTWLNGALCRLLKDRGLTRAEYRVLNAVCILTGPVDRVLDEIDVMARGSEQHTDRLRDGAKRAIQSLVARDLIIILDRPAIATIRSRLKRCNAKLIQPFPLRVGELVPTESGAAIFEDIQAHLFGNVGSNATGVIVRKHRSRRLMKVHSRGLIRYAVYATSVTGVIDYMTQDLSGYYELLDFAEPRQVGPWRTTIWSHHPYGYRMEVIVRYPRRNS